MIKLAIASEKEILESVSELKELAKVVEDSREWHKHDSVLAHTMRVFEKLKLNLKLQFLNHNYFDQKVGELTRKECLLWAALFHDIAKPETMILVDGFTKCPDHEALGAEKAKRVLGNISMSEADRDRIVLLVMKHDELSGLMGSRNDNEDLTMQIQELMETHADIFPELVLLTLSDMEGSQLQEANPKEFEFRREMYYELLSSVNTWPYC
jgi:putative nucleotidyltransferase with HDIG domain